MVSCTAMAATEQSMSSVRASMTPLTFGTARHVWSIWRMIPTSPVWHQRCVDALAPATAMQTGTPIALSHVAVVRTMLFGLVYGKKYHEGSILTWTFLSMKSRPTRGLKNSVASFSDGNDDSRWLAAKVRLIAFAVLHKRP